MSRTFRDNPISYLRNPQTLNEVKLTKSKVEEMEEYGFSSSNREKEIANFKKPSAFDDISNSGVDENLPIILLNSLKSFFNEKTFIPKEITDEIAKIFYKKLYKNQLFRGLRKEYVNMEVCGGKNTFDEIKKDCLFYNDSYALNYNDTTGFWIFLTL